LGPWHGDSSRRPSGDTCAGCFRQSSPAGKEAGPGRTIGVLRRHSLDPLDGGALELAAAPVRQLDDLLAAAQAVGETGCCWPSGAPCSRPSTTARNCGGTSASWTAASPRRKKGRQSRPDQAREGPEVDGTGPWRGYSAGSIPGRGVPGGGDAAGPHAGEHAVEGPACPAHRRSGLRQQWPAPEAQRRGIQPIIPAQRNHPNATDQDGRCLGRYRRRWIVERTIGGWATSAA
jgi:hypothetical protein